VTNQHNTVQGDNVGGTVGGGTVNARDSTSTDRRAVSNFAQDVRMA